MRLVTLTYGKGASFRFVCDCGWRSPVRFTVEAAGRDADLHMAEKFPLGSERRPCDSKAGDKGCTVACPTCGGAGSVWHTGDKRGARA